VTTFSRRALRWTPRVLSVAFIAFLALFSLDVLGQGRGFWWTLWALAMHLIPCFALTAVLLLAWRWEWVGAAFYGAAGLWYVKWALALHIPPAVKLNWILVIAGPAFVIAALFLVAWFQRRSLRLVQ